MVFIELYVKKIACIFEVITTCCAELDRCSVVFGFPFFSLLLALHYSGSSFLSGWKAWLSAVTSSHTWLQVVVVLYAASCLTVFPPPPPQAVALRVTFLKVSIKRHNKCIQIILQWFLHSFLPALDSSVIPLPVAHDFCAICISLTNDIHSATPFLPKSSTFSAINILAR